MPIYKAFVINQSDHELRIIGYWGSMLTWEQDMIIPPHQSVAIGTIESSIKNKQSWGWWYIQDSLNKAVFECYAEVQFSSRKKGKAEIGLKSNANHRKDRPEGPASNPSPRYLHADYDGRSVIYTILSEWTQNPPDFIFNYGHYCCFVPHPPRHELAAHAYLIARNFNGEQKIEFPCYGNVTPDYHPEEWVDVAGTYLGSADQLRLARVICCFDPDDSRDLYYLKPFRFEDTFKPVGKLGLGDCSGIIFGASGVCQHMANRIAAAVTDRDAGGMAAMPAYNLSHFIWGPYGSLPPVIGPEWAKLKPLIQRFFADIYPPPFEERMVAISEEAPYPVNLLFRPWEEYFAECKKVAGIKS